MRTHLLRLCLGLWIPNLLFFGSSARSEEATGANPASTELRLSVPVLYHPPQAVPLNFSSDSLLPPFNLVLSHQPHPRDHTFAWLVEANLTFPHSSIVPAIGITPGGTYSLGDWFLEGWVDAQAQTLPNKAPYAGSPFDTWAFSLIAGVGYRVATETEIGLHGRFTPLGTTTIARYEGLDTAVGHSSTFALSPWVRILVPVVDIELRGRVDVELLGAAAIASKEFALGLGSQTVEHFQLRATRRLGSLGVSLQYDGVAGVRDPIELSYLAPFYYRDYLMVPHSLSVGVSWFF